jgi:hypothetical protein
MTKPSPADATTKLDAARNAVTDHLKELIEWRSLMGKRGNKAAAEAAWGHIAELRVVSSQLDELVGSWNNLINARQGKAIHPSVKPSKIVAEPKLATTRAPHRKRPATNLRVTMSDGTVIEEKSAAATMVQFVKHVGIDRVMTVDLRVDGNAFVSSNPLTTHSHSSWKPLGGYFIGTHTNNTEKREQILKIAETLGLEAEVEVS